MKRLLIPFLALALTACNKNDIVVTSEVGEKMIVERDTIILRKTSKDKQESLDKLINIVGESVELSCNSRWPSPETCAERKRTLAGYEYERELNKGTMWWQEFRYLPVHRDRNGTETVQKEKFVTCVSPNLSEKDKAELGRTISGMAYLNKYRGRTLHDSVARTICKEYATWEMD